MFLLITKFPATIAGNGSVFDEFPAPSSHIKIVHFSETGFSEKELQTKLQVFA